MELWLPRKTDKLYEVPTSIRRNPNRWHPTEGRATLINPDGSIAWEEEFQLNFLADEGEQNILNTWLLEQSHLTKYLVLLTATPDDTTTMATMTEVRTPGTDGYARQQIVAGDWSAPVLNSGDYQTSATEKIFGPATGTNWTSITYVGLVTTSTGTAGKFMVGVALSGSTNVNVGQSLKYTLRQKAQ